MGWFESVRNARTTACGHLTHSGLPQLPQAALRAGLEEVLHEPQRIRAVGDGGAVEVWIGPGPPPQTVELTAS